MTQWKADYEQMPNSDLYQIVIRKRESGGPWITDSVEDKNLTKPDALKKAAELDKRLPK